jgi:hypothetical protein
MAKDSNKTAGALKAAKTGSMLSGLLADENEFDRRALWRIGWWGAAAVAAVMVAVFANQASLGWRRDRLSASDVSRQAQLIQSLARETQSESRQLASANETLNNDRDRLYARITVLEQGLESVTGALAKQNLAQAPAGSGSVGKTASTPTQVAAADSPSASPSSPTSAQPAAGAGSGAPGSGSPTAAPTSQSGPNPVTAGSAASPSPPVVSPVATTIAAVTERPRAETARPSPVPAPASPGQTQTQAQTPVAASASGPPSPSAALAQIASTAPTVPAAAASLVAPRSIMAPPDPAASRLTEPDKLAKLEATPQRDTASTKSGDATDAAPTAVQRTEFAVDLGSANSLSGLRALWRGLTKTNLELAALRPIIILKEGNTGLGMQLRLGAGPLNDAAAAAKICASLAESQRPCETTVFDGQRLAIRSDDSEAAEAGKETSKETGKQPTPGATQQTGVAQKPAAPPQRRRTFQQRHGAREEPPAPPAPPPPPPPTSTLSSLFHRQ